MIQPCYLALDVGDRRIGAAVSISGVIAQPAGTILRTGRTQVLDAVQRLVEVHSATDCVLGLPLMEDGSEGEQVNKTRAFGRSLARRLPRLRIHFWDERYSSADARDLLQGRTPLPGEIDSLAAALILQEFLAQHPRDATTVPS